jgi:hypothetical protein
MMTWIRDTLQKQKADPNIIWKASSMHHPMFGLHYDDYETIIGDFLPLIQDAKYDVFFNGHEHLQNYAHHPYDGKFKEQGPFEKTDDSCMDTIEWFPENGPEKDTRFYEEMQYDSIHQLTIGASGKQTYPLCRDQYEKTSGNFKYGENAHNGYALVHITESEFTVQIKGVENYNPSPDPYFRRFLKDKIGITKWIPEQMQKQVFAEEHPEDARVKTMDLFKVRINRDK